MRSYEAARGLFGFLAFCAWGVIVIGVVIAVMGGIAANVGFRGQTELQVLLGAVPGAIVALTGFFGLALVQMGRATVDSAEYGQQALAVSRQQLEVSRETLAQGKAAAASYEALLKRRPVLEANADEPAQETDAGPSYSTRPELSEPVAELHDQPEEQLNPTGTPDTSAQLEDIPIMPAPGVLENIDPVTFKKGMWHVGDRVFQTETPARNYAARLAKETSAV